MAKGYPSPSKTPEGPGLLPPAGRTGALAFVYPPSPLGRPRREHVHCAKSCRGKAIGQVVGETPIGHLLWARPVSEVLLATEQHQTSETTTEVRAHSHPQSTLGRRDVVSHFTDEPTEAWKVSPVGPALDAESWLESMS